MRWLLLLIPVALILSLDVPGMVAAVTESVAALGPMGWMLFVAAYVLATLAGLPISLLALSAGPLFGFLAGVALVTLGAMLGATLGFLLARRLSAHRKRAPRGRVIALSRIAPVPFGLTNYAWGLTDVSFGKYFLWTAIGLFPSIVLSVAGGKALLQSAWAPAAMALVLLAVGARSLRAR